MAIQSISNHYKAMLDTIAYTEGCLGVSQNGYDVLYAHYVIVGWTPDCTFGHGGSSWGSKYKDGISTASGRYQFLSTTWYGLSKKYKNDLNLSQLSKPISFGGNDYYYNAPFSKANQDYFGFKLLQDKRKVSQSDLEKAAKSPTDFAKMIQSKILDCEWSSLVRALPVGAVKSCGGAGGSSSSGQIKHPQVCQPSGCKDGADEIWSVYTKALKKY